MAIKFLNKKFSDYLGEPRAILDINAQFYDASPTPTPTSSITPTPTITPTKTPTPTPTPTPTLTPTITPTSSCPVTTQYLEVLLPGNTKFKLVLWNRSDFTSPAVALCEYQISGTAFGSMGTTYNTTESINLGQHQHEVNLASILQPGEIVTGFTANSYITIGCQCPVNLILP